MDNDGVRGFHLPAKLLGQAKDEGGIARRVNALRETDSLVRELGNLTTLPRSSTVSIVPRNLFNVSLPNELENIRGNRFI